VPAVLVAAVTVLPVIYLFVRSGTSGWSAIVPVLQGPRTASLVRNTIALTVTVTTVCVVVGTASAWVVARTRVPGRRVWAVLLTLPLGLPAFVTAYTWAAASFRFAPTSTALFGLGGATLVLGLALYPFVYLPVVAALRGLDPAQEETARALGKRPLQVFLTVVLPQLRPAILGGAIIVALHMLAEFGALAMLRYDTLTIAIFDQYTLGEPQAALALSGLLTVFCLVILTGDLLLRGRAAPHRVGRGAARVVGSASLGWRAPLVLAGLGLLVALALGVPLVSTATWLLDSSGVQVDLGDLGRALAASTGYSGAAAVAASVLAFPVAVLAVRHRGPTALGVERATYIAHSLPGLVIALSLVFFATRYADWVYQTAPLLVLAYVVLFLPIALGPQQAALNQIPSQLEDVARSLGSRPRDVLRRITLPLMLRGVGAGAVLVFLSTGKELTATLLLRPTGTDTLATALWSRTTLLDYAGSAPYAALLVLLGAAPATFLARRVLADVRD
jgi:iron(III) transport system permease protein